MEIDKKELNKILIEQKKDFQVQSNRYLKMLSEDFESKIKVIGESTQDIPIIKKSVKNLEEKVERIEDNIELIKFGLKRKADIEEFISLAKRVSVLEKN